MSQSGEIMHFKPLRVLRPDFWDSPTGCLATEREVEYFKRGCSLSRTRQLAGAMAFYGTKGEKNKSSAKEIKREERRDRESQREVEGGGWTPF